MSRPVHRISPRMARPDAKEFRWANETGANGLITVEEARYLGYEPVPCRCGCGEPIRDPRYGSVLMRRDG